MCAKVFFRKQHVAVFAIENINQNTSVLAWKAAFGDGASAWVLVLASPPLSRSVSMPVPRCRLWSSRPSSPTSVVDQALSERGSWSGIPLCATSIAMLALRQPWKQNYDPRSQTSRPLTKLFLYLNNFSFFPSVVLRFGELFARPPSPPARPPNYDIVFLSKPSLRFLPTK